MSATPASAATSGKAAFGDALAARVHERESQIVLGLDPDPAALWPGVAEGELQSQELTVRTVPWPSGGECGVGLREPTAPAARAAAAIVAHCCAVIDAVGPACVAVKLQLARFEALGAAGRLALGAVADHARAVGLLVIADAKRGDIDVTAQAYADSLLGDLQTPFGAIAGLGADMVTVNPLLGADALAPFIATARAADAGVLLLVRTSNPGAADVQDLELAAGGTVWERLAELAEELGQPGVGESGLSDVGAVVGATVPAHLRRARELMPHAVFLLPGVGAQGGRVEDLAPAFALGHAGGLIAASRAIVRAHLASGGDPATSARREAERLREVAWALAA